MAMMLTISPKNRRIAPVRRDHLLSPVALIPKKVDASLSMEAQPMQKPYRNPPRWVKLSTNG